MNITLNNKPYCFIIWGISNAGKDTIYKLINKRLATINVKWVHEPKRVLENWLEIPVGSFDDKEFRKNNLVKNTVTGQLEDYTYDDLITGSFHAWDIIAPGGWLTVGYTLNNILQNLTKSNIAFTDTRKPIELSAIQNQLAPYYNLVLIHVVGRGTKKSSDESIRLEDFAFVPALYYIHNPPELSIGQLELKVNRILDNLLENN